MRIITVAVLAFLTVATILLFMLVRGVGANKTEDEKRVDDEIQERELSASRKVHDL